MSGKKEKIPKDNLPSTPMDHYDPNVSLKNSSELSVMDLWHILVSFKKVIVLSVFVTTIVGIVYSFLATPVYRAEVLMISAQNEEQNLGGLASLGQFSGLAGLAGINLGSNNIEEALAVLQSRKFVQEFINENNLMPVLFADEWNEKKRQWKGTPSMESAYNMVRDELLTVSMNIKTQLITFSIDWIDPKQSADWANAMVKRVNDHIRQHAIEEAEKSIYFLEEQLQSTSLINAQSVLHALVEEQTKNIMLANVRDEYAFKVIDPAFAPEKPYKPNKLLILIVCFLLGLILGIFIALIKNTLENNTVSRQG